MIEPTSPRCTPSGLIMCAAAPAISGAAARLTEIGAALVRREPTGAWKAEASAVMPARSESVVDRMLDCRGVFSDALARGVRRRQLWFGGDAPSLSLFLNPKTVGRSPLPLDIVNECQRGGGAARAAAASTTFTGQ